MLSLSKHSGQRPLRVTLRQAQGDRLIICISQHVISIFSSLSWWVFAMTFFLISPLFSPARNEKHYQVFFLSPSGFTLAVSPVT